MTRVPCTWSRSRQRGIGLLAVVVGTLVLLGISVALVVQMRSGSAATEASFNDAQRAIAAVNALRAAIAECALNYPLTATGPEAPRAAYVLFDQTAAGLASTAASTPNTPPGDVSLVNWSSQLYCPGRSTAAPALPLWVGPPPALSVPSASRLSVGLRMGTKTETDAKKRAGSIYLVVACGTDQDATVAKLVLKSIAGDSTADAFSCTAEQEVLLAP